MRRFVVIVAAAFGAGWLAAVLSEPLPRPYVPQDSGPPRSIR